MMRMADRRLQDWKEGQLPVCEEAVKEGGLVQQEVHQQQR